MRATASRATRNPPIRADHDRALDLGRHQLGDRAAGARAGVVDDDLRRADRALDRGEHPRHLGGVDRVAGKGLGPGFGAKRRQLFGVARGQRHAHPLAGEKPRQARR